MQSGGFPGAGGCASSTDWAGTLWFPTAEGSVTCVCTAGDRLVQNETACFKLIWSCLVFMADTYMHLCCFTDNVFPVKRIHSPLALQLGSTVLTLSLQSLPGC